MIVCRGLRGATTVAQNDAAQILEATRELFEELVSRNQVQQEDVGSVILTSTPDLDAVYPAVAVRRLGWTHTALMCMQEMAVPGSLPRCIRVLIHWNTARTNDQLQHVYLHEARGLRPDLAAPDTSGA